MRKLILMTSAAIIAPLSGLAEDITCTATPNCADLGYTETSCSENNGVKCPWGDTYFCPPSEAEICERNNFVYTCDGEKQTGGVGETCHEKYAECSCAEKYGWKNGECKFWGTCTGKAQSCNVGDILFNDGTCNADVVDGKTAIAVVVYKSDDGKCGQAMALDSIGSYAWGGKGTDISSLPNYTSSAAVYLDLDSCGNTAKIIAAGDKSKYPAAWAAHEYSTEGTSAGDWCLPAAGIFTSYYNNQDAVNTGFSRVGGTKFTNTTYAWSSSEYYGNCAWYSCFATSYGVFYYLDKSNSYEVRPVLAF